MLDPIGIIGFLVILYTAYLIVTEGSKKKEDEVTDNSEQSTTEQPKPSKPKQQKPKKSAPVQNIQDDNCDVLRQGKGYSEQESFEQPNVTPQYQQHFEEQNTQKASPEEMQPSSKYDEPAKEESAGADMVSIKCPYCDTVTLVPRGGNAECSCCTSVLNDAGNVVG